MVKSKQEIASAKVQTSLSSAFGMSSVESLQKINLFITDGILQQICVGKHFLLFDELAGQEQHSYISQDPHLADLMN